MTNKHQSWQRARQPEQIQIRRKAILLAAGTLLDSGGLDETGLNAIAREAGISKANVYRYFESREAILLQLLHDEVEVWATAFGKRLRRIRDAGNVDPVAKAFAESVSKQPRFCILIGALAAVLEHNVDRETVVTFKRNFLTAVAPAVAALEAAIPALSADESFSVLEMLVIAASGAWPHCHPAPVVRDVLEEPEFSQMALQFTPFMQEYAAIMLNGMLAKHAQ